MAYAVEGRPEPAPRDDKGRYKEDGKSRVICTQLLSEGFLDRRLWLCDVRFTLETLSPTTIRGYHLWAVPYVRLMRRYPLASEIIRPLSVWRAKEVAYQVGQRSQPHYGGKLVRAVGEPLCWLLGRVAPGTDWHGLYASPSDGAA